MDLPNWVVSVLSLLGAGVGAWVAVQLKVARLQTQMEGVMKQQDQHGADISRHNEDLLVHDMEIESALQKLDLQRARRQRLRSV